MTLHSAPARSAATPRLALLLALGLLASAPLAAAETVRLARDPALSPDGQRLAFSWHGDVFVAPSSGGDARRLTVHPAEDRQPRWSPDGKRLAFMSERHGHRDVFVMDADGASVRRLTFHSDADTDAAWTPDGESVVFGSRRQNRFSQETPLWIVPADGRRDPGPFTDFAAQDPALSPDGRWLAFVRGRVAVLRREHDGPAAPDVWLLDRRTDEIVRATPTDAADDSPSWLTVEGRSLLAYRSSEGGVENVWMLDPLTLQRRQLTRHDDPIVTRPRAGGPFVVYEHLDALRRLDVRDGTDVALRFEAPADTAVQDREALTLSRGASDLALSADGEVMALVVRGEVAVARADDEPIDETASRVTGSPARDREPAFVPSGDEPAVIFSSDREGRYDLWRATPRADAPTAVGEGLAATLAWEVERLTRDEEDERAPRVSPDGTRVAFRRGRGDLVVRDLESGRERMLSAGWNLGDVRWSPDSQWLAFSRNDDEFNSDVFVLRADGSGEPINVSLHPDDDDRPRWSANGRALVFRTQRPSDENQVALAFLRAADFRLDGPALEQAWKKAAKARAALDAEARKKKKDGPDEKPKKDTDEEDEEGEDDAALASVVIDADEIHLRVRLLADMPGGGDLAPAPDGLSVAFGARDLVGKTDLWIVGWDGDDEKRLTNGGKDPSELTWTADGKSIVFLADGGRVQRVAASGGSVDTLPFSVRVTVDRAAERRQVFAEAWRLLDQNFYDPDFHGVDWDAMRRRYAPIAEAVGTHGEFQEVVRRMLGELDASHLGISGGPEATAGSEETGELGLELEADRNGWRVARVVRDGPAASAEPPVETGDVVEAIDDIELDASTRLHALMVDRVGERVRLRVRKGRRASVKPGETIETVVRPVSTRALRDLLYEEWVEEKRATVDRLSKGRIAYVHVEGMNVPSLARFEQELHSVASGRGALLVDVRNNGGGWTTDLMLAMLMVRPHAVTVPRGGGRGYPEDRRVFYAWSKPMAALANEYSYSNAEIFSHAIKTLDRGPVVGTQTAGAVISTGGERLLDGSWLRLPFRGWYVEGSGVNMEGHGAVPDVPVSLGPEDQRAGRDPQLEAAVNVLLEALPRRRTNR